MSVRRAVILAASVLAVGTLAACENTAAGTPTPESDVSTPSETESDRLAPPVENPKDLTGIDPCELLTQSQLAELSFTEAGKKDMSQWDEPKCNWFNSTLSVGLAPDTTQGNGLEGTYRAKDNFDNFEESEVDGYPAVRADFASQVCSVIVGIADDQELFVHYGRVASDAPGKGDPCGFAEEVASMVLTNLPDE